MTEQEYINQLRKQFIDKINNEWSQEYSNFGNDFSSVNNNYGKKSNFLNAVRENIKKAILEKFNLDIDNYPTIKGNKEAKMSGATIEKIITSELKSDVSIKIISQYLGYTNFEAFKNQYVRIDEEALPAQPESQSIGNDIIPHNQPNTSNLKGFYTSILRYRKVLILTLFVGLISVITYLLLHKKIAHPISKNNNVIVVDSLFFKNIIYLADSAEYKAYKKMPIIDTLEVDFYFTQKGSARATIVQKLVEHHKKNYTITNNNNPSYYRVYSCRFISFNPQKNEVYLETEEKWYLQWYGIIEKKYEVGYNEHNIQKYTLKYEDDRWKVDINDYEGKPYKMGF